MNKFITFLLILSFANSYSQYSTPNTGVIWTLDSLKLHSNGALDGGYGDYIFYEDITISENDHIYFDSIQFVVSAYSDSLSFILYGDIMFNAIAQVHISANELRFEGVSTEAMENFHLSASTIIFLAMPKPTAT